VSRRILGNDATPKPPPYFGSYDLAGPYLDARSSSFLSPFDTLMIHHGDDFTPLPENQKTYRRLFGMIFLEGFDPVLTAVLQRLATQKIFKKRKNSKANSIFIS